MRNNESIWQLEEEAAVVLSRSLQINLNCYLFCNHLNKALYSPEPCPPSKQRFSPSSPVLFCYPLQLFFCPYREYGCCLGCLIYFRCYILDVIRSFFFFFFFRALLLSEGVLHLLWRFGVWWIEFLQTFYLTGCIATAPIPGYRTRAAASAIWKTAYPLWVACSAEAFDHKAHGNRRLSSFTASQLHKPDCSGSHTVSLWIGQRENTCQ